MSWSWFFSTEKTEAPDATSRDDRKKCWESRDAYFACLDRANVVKPGEEGSACGDVNKKYQENCAKSWIDYFNKRRVLAEQQQGVLSQAKMQADTARNQ